MTTIRTCRKWKLTKQPLALVLIQTRYSPISNLNKYIPDIQDELRRIGFPYMATRKETAFDLLPTGIQPTIIEQWVFETVDKHTSVIMDERQVLLQSTQYDAFEIFLEQYLIVLNIVMKITEHETYGICERIGLRYVDQVVKQSEMDTIDSYLRPELRGMSSSFFMKDKKRYAFTNVVITQLPSMEPASLSIRVYRNNNTLDLPPDVHAGAPPRLRNIDTLDDFALIDMDHSCTIRLGPGIQKEVLEKLFFGLHDVIIEVFYESVVSKEGTQKWK
jgi:uncharacterized protein (TIGR04255 family)